MTLENIKMENSMNIDISGYLILILDKNKALVKLEHVKEILGMREYTRVPGLPEYMLGVTNVRGQVVPICDLRMRFSLNADMNEKTCIVIVETMNGDLGIVVDEIQGIKRDLDMSKIKVVENKDISFFKGYYPEKDEVIYVLDFLE